MRSRLLALVYFSSLLSCRGDAHHDSVVAREAGRAGASPHDVDVLDEILDSDAGVTELTEPRVEYAFARHLERSEQRRGDALLFDFGIPGDAKYRFGGWLGRRIEAQTLEQREALRVRSYDLKVVLPSLRADLTQLTVEVKSFARGNLSVFSNGRAVDVAELQGQGFETVVMRLPAGALKRGDNLLELRLAPSDIAEPGFALDFIALSQPTASASELAPVPPSELHPDPNLDTLRLPPGLALSFAFEVPSGGIVLARASASTPAALTVRAVCDGADARVLGVFAVPARAQALQLDLRAFAGELVRLEFEAQHGAVWLEQPRLETLHPLRAPPPKPVRNVLLYLVDTLRADKLAAYNPATRVRTPGLERFLQHSAVMTAARAQENWTKPSVATLFSGLLPWQHSTASHESVLPSEVELLPEHLRARGFFTGAFISNGYVSDKFGFNQGFATYRNYVREGLRGNAPAVAADVTAWLDARPKEQPFFLYVHTIDPHVPYQPPREFLSLYDTEPYAGPVTFARSAELLDEVKRGSLPLEPRDRARLIALYDGAISFHDAHFAAIMRALAERGLDSNTLVIVTADHGEEFWDHGSVGHGHSLYDELLHVPLFVRLPKVTQGGDRVNADVGLVDVAPTILDALGEPPSAWMQGSSFLPELLGESADAPRASVAGFLTNYRALAVGRYKLVQRQLERSFLYDTSKDPGETRDLSAERPIALAYVRGLLGLTLADSKRAKAAAPEYPAEKTVIDAVTEQQLRALGYVGGSVR